MAPEIAGKWSIAPLPKGPSGKRTAFIGGRTMGIFSKSAMKKESWEFIKFLFKPENQVKIIKGTGSKNIGIIYNFHHGHEQLDRYSSLLKIMMPYLSTVNINGMRNEGPKIIPLGGGDLELGMLKELKKSGFSGTIGILGHTENEDIRKPLERNLNGLKSLLSTMNENDALKSY